MAILIRDKKDFAYSDILAPFSKEESEKVLGFHKSLPGYSVTPLVSLDSIAKKLGVKAVYVKNESERFGLNAFKALGGSYAIARSLAKRFNIGEDELSFEKLTSAEYSDVLSGLTFATATDGNHGRGVAWTANILGCKSVVYMPKGSCAERLENIRKENADASITDLSYDDAVRKAAADSKLYGWELIQDTAAPGYTAVPTNIMQGYMTMANEAEHQLGGVKPTHVFLQAGVGSMAAAVLAYFASSMRTEKPAAVIVEADKADCIYRTAKADDGQLHFAEGEMDTMMAGLACGEPCSIAWDIIDKYAEGFVTIDDSAAAQAMIEYAANGIVAGESGCAGLGGLLSIFSTQDEDILKKLSLNSDSVILLINTEGATDTANYNKIVDEN